MNQLLSNIISYIWIVVDLQTFQTVLICCVLFIPINNHITHSSIQRSTKIDNDFQYLPCSKALVASIRQRKSNHLDMCILSIFFHGKLNQNTVTNFILVSNHCSSQSKRTPQEWYFSISEIHDGHQNVQKYTALSTI